MNHTKQRVVIGITALFLIFGLFSNNMSLLICFASLNYLMFIAKDVIPLWKDKEWRTYAFLSGAFALALLLTYFVGTIGIGRVNVARILAIPLMGSAFFLARKLGYLASQASTGKGSKGKRKNKRTPSRRTPTRNKGAKNRVTPKRAASRRSKPQKGQTATQNSTSNIRRCKMCQSEKQSVLCRRCGYKEDSLIELMLN